MSSHSVTESLQSLDVGLWQGEYSLSLERNGVAHVAAVPGGQTGAERGDGSVYQTYHLLVGVGAAFVDLQTGVAAAQTFQCHFASRLLIVGHFLVAQCGGDVDAAGRTDDELTPELGVEVEQDLTIQLAFGQIVGTIHARLLVGSDESLNGTVFQVSALHDTHDGSNTDAVVTSQGRALSLYPSVLNIGLDGIVDKVVCTVGCFLRHHVHVGLQQHRLTVLHAGSGRLAHDDIVTGVLEGFHTYTLGKIKQELLYLLQMARGAGHLCEGIEIAPDGCWLQIFNFAHSICYFGETIILLYMSEEDGLSCPADIPLYEDRALCACLSF